MDGNGRSGRIWTEEEIRLREDATARQAGRQDAALYDNRESFRGTATTGDRFRPVSSGFGRLPVAADPENGVGLRDSPASISFTP